MQPMVALTWGQRGKFDTIWRVQSQSGKILPHTAGCTNEIKSKKFHWAPFCKSTKRDLNPYVHLIFGEFSWISEFLSHCNFKGRSS